MVKGGPAKIDGEYHNETDNFQPIKFKLNGIEFFSAENYFQCMKTTSKEEFEKIRNSGCGMDVNLFLIFFFLISFFHFQGLECWITCQSKI